MFIHDGIRLPDDVEEAKNLGWKKLWSFYGLENMLRPKRPTGAWRYQKACALAGPDGIGEAYIYKIGQIEAAFCDRGGNATISFRSPENWY